MVEIVAWALVGGLVSFGAVTSASIGLAFVVVGAVLAFVLVLRRRNPLLADAGGFTAGAGVGLFLVAGLVDDAPSGSILLIGGAVLVGVGILLTMSGGNAPDKRAS